MAESETLAALKRAYADTILNTTKEAAARVMVSEKKARRYQQELVTVRDEALHTLLRLKQMLDSKVKETEMISLKQQQKVEELEAQLGEAEDIVGELRMELKVLHDELKKLTNGQTHLKSDHEEVSCKENRNAAVSLVPGAVGSCIPVEQSGSVVANGIKIPSLTRISSINQCSYKDNKDRYTLPSILTKRREAEGGCSQIIHAVDNSMANGDVNDDGVCLHKVSSSKSVETLGMSGCADADTTDSLSSARDGEAPMVSQNSSQKDVGTLVSLETSTREDGNERKLEVSETEARKEEETRVLAVAKSRCIKYTFKRKRKREVISNIEGDASFEESRKMKQKSGEKEDGYLESMKPSFTSEPSSRDVVYA